MADFELRVDDRAFNRLNVQINFDENRYGVLLDSLVEVVPVDETPLITLTPARIWGMSRLGEIRSMLAREDEDWPSSQYEAGTRTIKVRADEAVDTTNQMLLRGTRLWAGDLSGERAEANQADWQRRNFRRGTMAVTIGGGAVAGYEAMGGDGAGAFIGSVVGATVGLGGLVVDKSRSPYHKTVNQFTKDPNVLAEYGKIVSYQLR